MAEHDDAGRFESTQTESIPWKPIESAPKDGSPFLALNHDLEVHVARFDENGRILRRSHQQRQPMQTRREGDKEVVVERGKLLFETHWSVWTNGYEFRPTHWMPLPEPPTDT